jgi:hypothetical protein
VDDTFKFECFPPGESAPKAKLQRFSLPHHTSCFVQKLTLNLRLGDRHRVSLCAAEAPRLPVSLMQQSAQANSSRLLIRPLSYWTIIVPRDRNPAYTIGCVGEKERDARLTFRLFRAPSPFESVLRDVFCKTGFNRTNRRHRRRRAVATSLMNQAGLIPQLQHAPRD